MTRNRRVLIVAYYFPPAGNVGVHRTVRFVRHLPAFGWDPVVLTVSNARTSDIEPSLSEKVPVDVPVHRCRSFELFNGGKSLDGRPRPSHLAARLIRKLPASLWQTFAVPDEKVGWVPFATRGGARLIRDYDVEAIYVTGKPFSSYLVGERLSRRFGLPWVMDLRDLWTLNRRTLPRSALHARFEPRMERRLVVDAACVIANTPGDRADFVAAFPDHHPEKFVAITNGFDRDDFAGLPDDRYDEFTIGYSGTFYCGRVRARTAGLYDTYSPKHLFRAVRELFVETPGMASRTRLKFTGPGCSAARELAFEHGLEANVDLLGWIGYEESLSVLRRSHLCPLMLSCGEESAGWIPSKLFQYLGAGTPVLGLVPEGDVAAILRDTGAGWVVPPDDIVAIKTALRRAYDRYLEGMPPLTARPDRVARFEARFLTGRLADCLDRAAGPTAADRRSISEVKVPALC